MPDSEVPSKHQEGRKPNEAVDLDALFDLFERSRTWDEETLRRADPLFLLLRARLLVQEKAQPSPAAPIVRVLPSAPAAKS